MKRPDSRPATLPTESQNNLAADMTGLAFRIAAGAIRWEGSPVHLPADDVLATEGEAPERDTELHRAIVFLRDTWERGPMETKEIINRADDEGISESTLRRAKKKAGVLDGRSGFGPGSSCHRKLPPKSATLPAQARPP